MADFDIARNRLADGRRAQKDAQAALANARERLAALTSEEARRARSANAGDRAAASGAAHLSDQKRTASADLDTGRANARSATEAAQSALGNFAVFTDPRRNVGRLDDATPFALFPVRIETRFVTVGSGDAAKPQLWLRIYPDDVSIDTFEATLSTFELRNMQRYWQNLWRSGGVDGDDRAAWGALVAATGSGRASYLVQTYEPLNRPAPQKADPSDVLLTIATQSSLGAAEAAAIAAFWPATWRAEGNAATQAAARATLDAAVGAARADELVVAYRPFNYADAPVQPHTRADVAVSVVFVVFPVDPPLRKASWTEAPHVADFPERFVALGYENGVQTLEAIGNVVATPLCVGPDPSADPNVDPTSAIHPDGEDLFIPDPLLWMVDFERAVAAGMGIAIDLTPAQARGGFDRLLVLGLQLGASAADGKTALEELLTHHAAGRSGLSLVPQGTPTHNSSGTGTGYTKLDNADQSYEDRKHSPLFVPTSVAADKRDGQWLGELLGIDPALLQTIHAADGRDQLQARAMQQALWPATLGYWMDKLLSPVFGDAAVANTRWFFTEFVSGRGPVPSIRIGGQPYGVLPTTAFSRIRWLDPERGNIRQRDPRIAYLHALYTILRSVDADWAAMSTTSAQLDPSADPHQQLLDVVALHPSSVEFFSRYAESLSELFNTINLWGIGPDFINALISLNLHAAAQGLLAKLTYAGATQPDILKLFFLRDAQQVAQVIDDLPLSETRQIRPYTDDSRNYIRWLIDAAGTSLDALRLEAGFSKNETPQALLYLYLRHALMLGYYDTSYELHKTAGILSDEQRLAMKTEPTFIHVAESAKLSESRFAALYKTESAITGSPTQLVSDFIARNIRVLTPASGLRDQLDALARLFDGSTAQLERAFVEHIDLCSYRFDAWMLGIVNYQLQQMRFGGETPKTGVYLGGYAWVEDLRPSTARPTPVQLPDGVAGNFPGPSPILHDPRNGGFIHAPSLTQARTAAVLRAGYLANATPANPQTLSVNLSSQRVRRALSILEGIRNGQPLGALLGYLFERGLHDAYSLAEVDRYIYPLRKAFPLVADNLATTKTLPGVPIEAIEARNVFDGRKLIAQINTSGNNTYPYGLDAVLPAAAGDALVALNAQTVALLDAYDAIADLALAEGVHQAVQGNFDRVAGTLDAYTTGNFPPDPQVVQTPSEGIGLAHRVALHLQAGVGAPVGATPRAIAQSAVDAWLAHVLPPLNKVGCVVRWVDAAGTAQRQNVVCTDLDLHPLDLLPLIGADPGQATAELDDRVDRFVRTARSPRPDVNLKIEYMTAPTGDFSVFEVGALARALVTLLHGARPLKASDAALAQSATADANADVFVDRNRVAQPKTTLDTLGTDIDTYLGTLAPLVADTVVNRDALIAGIDGFIGDAVELLSRGALLGLPLCGWSFAYTWRHDAVRDLLAQVAKLVRRWDGKLADFGNRMTAYAALPAGTSDDVRIDDLRAAELAISTQPAPAPTPPAALAAMLVTKRAAFDLRRSQFADVATSPATTFAAFYGAVDALLPVSDFDVAAFDITSLGDRAVRLARDLDTNLASRKADILARSLAVQTQLDAHDLATTSSDRAAALDTAAKALFGDEFRIVPEFGITAAHGAEWTNTLNAATSGALLSYLKTTVGMDFPVDEWMCGVARVRPTVRAWESAVAISNAFGGDSMALTPAQFPYKAGEPWLAMQFDPKDLPDSDRVLYTAFYATPFAAGARQCGLLIDEWNELIPATTHTTGLTFNFNRPENEAAQAILLVTPATASGTWVWDDLVGALNETLDLAKKRAVEPTQIDSTPYAPLVPATAMAVTLYGISIGTSLSVANGVMKNVEIGRHV